MNNLTLEQSATYSPQLPMIESPLNSSDPHQHPKCRVHGRSTNHFLVTPNLRARLPHPIASFPSLDISSLRQLDQASWISGAEDRGYDVVMFTAPSVCASCIGVSGMWYSGFIK